MVSSSISCRTGRASPPRTTPDLDRFLGRGLYICDLRLRRSEWYWWRWCGGTCCRAAGAVHNHSWTEARGLGFTAASSRRRLRRGQSHSVYGSSGTSCDAWLTSPALCRRSVAGSLQEGAQGGRLGDRLLQVREWPQGGRRGDADEEASRFCGPAWV